MSDINARVAKLLADTAKCKLIDRFHAKTEAERHLYLMSLAHECRELAAALTDTAVRSELFTLAHELEIQALREEKGARCCPD